MSTSIKLDRIALRSLIDSDPDFKLELQRAVLSEVVTNLFEKDIRKILEVGDKAFLKQVCEAAADEGRIIDTIKKRFDEFLADRSGSTYWDKRVKLSAEGQKIVDQALEDAMTRVTAKISGTISAGATEALDKFTASRSLEERIEKRVNRLTEDHINAEVDRQVKARLAAIAAGINA